MNLRNLRSEKGVFTLAMSALAGLLSASMVNSTARQRILSLQSSKFGPNDESRLTFIALAFVLSGLFVYLIWVLNLNFGSSDRNFRFAKSIPSLTFVIAIVIPNFSDYFRGKPIFTDYQYTINFLTDKSVQKVSDNSLIYPESFLWLRNLPLPYESSKFQLFLLICGSAFFVFCISHYAGRLNLFQLFVFAVLLISPPIRWLFESQNIDLFIASVLYVCASIYKDKFSTSNSLALLLLALLSLLKVYSVPILVFLLLTSRVWAVRFQIFCYLAALIPILVFDVRKILSLIPLDPGNNSLGLKVILYFLGFPDSSSYLLIILSMFTVFLVFFSGKFRHLIPTVKTVDSQNFIVMFNLIVFTSCFFVTSNYPFRLVYLLFVIPACLDFNGSKFQRIVMSFGIVAFIAYKGSLGIIMNLFLLPIVVLAVYSFAEVAKQNLRSYFSTS